MSGTVCRQCGCGVVEKDAARGDTVCTNCGTVLEENAIVNEVQFQETSGGGRATVGQFVNPDALPKINIGGFAVGEKQSREATLQTARRRIQEVASQLRLNSHCVEMALNFYKMALSRDLTRGRAWTHTIAACLYITCRLEGTSHFLLDFSDVLQVNVFELGRTYNALARSLYITLPPTDPCVYVMRFANALEFGDKEHDVAMIALRLVQRMKRDWIAIGRRPTGLCGAALLLAARYHNFNRTINDIVRVANIGENVIRRRLDEFASTPSSSLTLDDFVTVDLEDECDPPAFNYARPKATIQMPSDVKLEKMRADLLKTEREIERVLENSKKNGKLAPKIENNSKKSTVTSPVKKFKVLPNLAYAEHASGPPDKELEISQEFLSQETLRHIMPSEFSDSQDADQEVNGPSKTPLSKYEQYRPTLQSLGVKIESNSFTNHSAINVQVEMSEKTKEGAELEDGTLDLTGIDDDEIDNYLLREDEISVKRRLWQIYHEPYLLEMEQKRLKREEEQRMLESQGLSKKRRPRTVKPKQPQFFASFGEAVEKIVQEKKLSSKINYDVLKSLTEPLSAVVARNSENRAHSLASSSQSQRSDAASTQSKDTVDESHVSNKKSIIVDSADKSDGGEVRKRLDATNVESVVKPVNFRKKPKPNVTLSKKSTS